MVNKFKGKGASRGCTDMFMLALFMAFTTFMVVVSIIGLKHGNPYRLLYGTDVNGNVCGHDDFGTNIWFPESSVQHASATGKYTDLHGYCVVSCPQAGALIEYNGKYGSSAPPKANVSTYSDFHRCVPSSGSSGTNSPSIISGKDSSTKREVMKQIEGMRHFIQPILIVGFVITPVLAVLYIALLGVCGGCLVWASLLGLFLVLLAGSAVTGCMADYWSLGDFATQPSAQGPTDAYTCDPGDALTAWQVVFWIFAVLTVVQVCITLCLCKRIRMGIAVIKQTSRAVLSMCFSLLSFPILPLLLFLAFFCYWLWTLAYVYTSGTAEKVAVSASGRLLTGAASTSGVGDSLNGAADTVSDSVNGARDSVNEFVHTQPTNDAVQGYVWAYIFWFFWTAEAIMAFGTMTVAGAISAWYWAGGREDGDRTKVSGEVCTSLWTTVRYHLGTVCFGALVIAVIRTIRAVLGYIQDKAEGVDNGFVKGVLCMLQCCLYCFQNFMKFVQKNGYIVCAVEGTGFCESCKIAFELLAANVLRVSAVSYISTFVLFIGKLLVSFTGLLIGFLWINGGYTSEVKEFLTNPAENMEYDTFTAYVVLFVLNYVVAYIVIETYDMAVDTMLLCVLIDEDTNQHTGEFYAPPDLRRFLDDESEEKGGSSRAAQPTVGQTPVALAPSAPVPGSASV